MLIVYSLHVHQNLTFCIAVNCALCHLPIEKLIGNNLNLDIWGIFLVDSLIKHKHSVLADSIHGVLSLSISQISICEDKDFYDIFIMKWMLEHSAVFQEFLLAREKATTSRRICLENLVNQDLVLICDECDHDAVFGYCKLLDRIHVWLAFYFDFKHSWRHHVILIVHGLVPVRSSCQLQLGCLNII